MGFEADRRQLRQEMIAPRPPTLQNIERREQDEVRRSENFRRVQNAILISNILLLSLFTFCTWIALYFLLLPLAKSIQEREKFLTNASHELRTPLAILHSELSLSQDEKSLKNIKKVHLEALSEIKRLQQLSNTLLGRQNDDVEIMVNVNEMIQNAWDSLQPINTNEIILNVHDTGTFKAKSVYFQQLIYHLIENVLKHAFPAKSTLSIQIDEKNKSIIFSNPCKSEEYQSSTGLNTCRELAEKTGFELKIEQKGNIFRVKLTQKVKSHNQVI